MPCTTCPWSTRRRLSLLRGRLLSTAASLTRLGAPASRFLMNFLMISLATSCQVRVYLALCPCLFVLVCVSGRAHYTPTPAQTHPCKAALVAARIVCPGLCNMHAFTCLCVCVCVCVGDATCMRLRVCMCWKCNIHAFTCVHVLVMHLFNDCLRAHGSRSRGAAAFKTSGTLHDPALLSCDLLHTCCLICCAWFSSVAGHSDLSFALRFHPMSRSLYASPLL